MPAGLPPGMERRSGAAKTRGAQKSGVLELAPARPLGDEMERGKGGCEAAENLLEVARLVTWPEKYIDKYGKKTYDIVLAEAHWTVYILLGKVEPTVWIVQKSIGVTPGTPWKCLEEVKPR